MLSLQKKIPRFVPRNFSRGSDPQKSRSAKFWSRISGRKVEKENFFCHRKTGRELQVLRGGELIVCVGVWWQMRTFLLHPCSPCSRRENGKWTWREENWGKRGKRGLLYFCRHLFVSDVWKLPNRGKELNFEIGKDSGNLPKYKRLVSMAQLEASLGTVWLLCGLVAAWLFSRNIDLPHGVVFLHRTLFHFECQHKLYSLTLICFIVFNLEISFIFLNARIANM